MITKSLICTFIILLPFQIFGQCSITVNAGPDINICAPGGVISLNGIASGANIAGTEWSPSTGIFDVNDLNTQATVNSTTTYTLTAQVFDPANNIIVNGDFSAGATSFTSDYIPGTGGSYGLLSNEGQYAISTNSSNVHNNFASCPDHTGGGNMMIVNGSTTANEDIWCQTVSVMPNTNYIFNTWVQSVISSNPAILQFSINGVLLGSTFTASPITCQWNEFNETWGSGGATTAEICIVNQNTTASGNDFAIDDIFFGPVCEQTDEVTISVIDVSAFVIPPIPIPCNAGPMGITLDGSFSSSGPGNTYQWTTAGGNITSGANSSVATADTPGTYTLTVTFSDGQISCTDMQTVNVSGPLNLPVAVASATNNIGCLNPMVFLNGIGSSIGLEFIYQWSTIDGNIVSGGDGLVPVVDESGTYEILVTNTLNGCTETATVTVAGNMEIPNAAANSPGSLDCQNSILILDGIGSSVGSEFDYQWTSLDGNIVSGDDTLNPTIDATGTYQILVTNSINGCTEVASVTVGGNLDPPIAVANSPGNLDCVNSFLILDGIGSSAGNEFSYQWSTFDGNITGGINTLNPTIDAAGTYEILVSNNTNGCTETASITVMGSSDTPIAVANSPSNIGCQNPFVILDGFGSSVGNQFSYVWSTLDGNIVSDGNSLNPTIDLAGTYEILILNNDNGCTETASVTVEGNIEIPIAVASVPNDLDCETPDLFLDGLGSSVGSEFSYLWNTVDGNILNGSNTLNPQINLGGTYTLVVTNNINGCTEMISVEVLEDFAPPTASIEMPDILTCSATTLILDGSNSSIGNEFSYQWNTADGNILNNANGLNPEIDAEGTYELFITNTINGCTASEIIMVDENVENPIAEAGDGFQLDCSVLSEFLAGDNSSQGANFDYQWTTPDGNILNGANTLNPEINGAGVYNLLITNTLNGCTNSDQVTITQDANVPVATAEVQDELNCLVQTLDIDATNSSSGTDLSFEWLTADGNFLANQNTLNPTIDAPGTYQLTVTNNDNGCEAITSITINQNIENPIAEAGLPDTLNCIIDELQLMPTGSSAGNEFQYEWTTLDGNIIGDANEFMPNVNSIGTYNLLITNTENGCTATDSVMISENVELPIADAGLPMEINCTDSILIIDGNASSIGNEFTYQWTTAAGNILMGQNGLNPFINAEGMYVLLVTNTENGCTANSTVDITENVIIPFVETVPMGILDCNNPQINLQANADLGLEFIYQWTTTNGNILAGTNTLNPEIDAIGNYQIIVTNTQNNCIAFAEVEVSENISFPVAEAGDPSVLSCSAIQNTLDGNGSEIGNNIIYQWTTNNGNILSGDDGLNPEINAPGIYTLTVIDNDNGCTGIDEVEVTQDVNAPIAEIAPADFLNCITNNLILNAENSSAGASIIYQWTTMDGNILNGETTLTPTIDAPGTYLLSVFDNANNCETLSSIIIEEDLTEPAAVIENAEDLTCTILSFNLNAENSSQGNEFTYQWTSNDGNILNGETSLTPEIDEAGTYDLLITNSENGCTSSNSIEIIQNIINPTVAIANPDEITCINLTVQLDAGNSSIGNEFIYEWTTTNGNITSGDNSLQPIINQEGDYQILITNNINGCTATANTSVLANVDSPMASAESSDNLTCTTLSILLSGENSSQGTNFSYEWTSLDGNIVMGENGLNPEVDETGIYQILVTNNENGCTALDEVEVMEDVTPPTVIVANPEILTCVTTEIALNANGSSFGTNFNINWTSTNGNIVSGNNMLNPVIDESGIYTMTILNIENGCEDSAQVTVEEDISLPIVEAVTPVELDCHLNEAQLEATVSNGNSFSYEWASNNGNILAGNNSLTPTISGTGNYSLIVTNLENGCTATDATFVTQNLIEGFDFSAQNPSCALPSGNISFGTVIGGIAPYVYSINGGDSFQPATIFQNLPANNYQLLVQDANGCEAENEVNILQFEDLNLFVEPQVILQLGDEYLIKTQLNFPDSEVESVSWFPAEGLSCSDCLRPIAQPFVTTAYAVEVITKDGCIATASIQFLVNKKVDIFFPNVFSPNGDGDNDFFFPFAENDLVKNIKTFKIFNRWGEEVFANANFLPNQSISGWDGKHGGKKLTPAVFAYFAEVVFLDGSVKLFKGDVALLR